MESSRPQYGLASRITKISIDRQVNQADLTLGGVQESLKRVLDTLQLRIEHHYATIT